MTNVFKTPETQGKTFPSSISIVIMTWYNVEDTFSLGKKVNDCWRKWNDALYWLQLIFSLLLDDNTVPIQFDPTKQFEAIQSVYDWYTDLSGTTQHIYLKNETICIIHMSITIIDGDLWQLIALQYQMSNPYWLQQSICTAKT